MQQCFEHLAPLYSNIVPVDWYPPVPENVATGLNTLATCMVSVEERVTVFVVLAPLIVKLLYLNAGIVCAAVPLYSTVFGTALALNIPVDIKTPLTFSVEFAALIKDAVPSIPVAEWRARVP